MTYQLADRAMETCTGFGTGGSLTLGGPVDDIHLAFGDKIDDGAITSYTLIQGNTFETADGIYHSAGNTIERVGAVHDSTNGGGRISIVAGDCVVFCCLPSERMFFTDQTGAVTADGADALRRAITFDTIANMQLAAAPADGVFIFCSGNAAVNDGLGGMFQWVAGDATAPDNTDTFRNGALSTGLYKRQLLKISRALFDDVVDINESVAVDGSGSSEIRLRTSKKSVAPNDNVYVKATGTASGGSPTEISFKIGARGKQSGDVDYFEAVSKGTNNDRIRLLKGLALPVIGDFSTVTDEKLFAFNSGGQLLYGDHTGTFEIPLTIGNFKVVTYTITDLYNVVADGLADGEIAMTLGASALGDACPAEFAWASGSSATDDGFNIVRPAVGAAATGLGRWIRINTVTESTFTNADTTPSVKNGHAYVTSGSTPITNLDDGYERQVVILMRGTSDIVIVADPTKILTNDGQNATLTLQRKFMVLQRINSLWIEIGGGSGLGGPVSFSGVITPTALSGDVDNWSPVDATSGLAVGSASGIRVAASVAVNINGLVGVASGRLIFIENVSIYNVTLAKEAVSSTAGNRFTGPSSVVILPGATVILRGDSSISGGRWTIISGGVSGPGTAVAAGDIPAWGDTTGSILAAGVRSPDSAWADVATATTVDLGAQATRNIRITGTTTVNGFGTASSGVYRKIRAGGNFTLTYNATSMILPGSASLPVKTGDTFTASSLGGGNWEVIDYLPAALAPFGTPMPDQRVYGNVSGSVGPAGLLQGSDLLAMMGLVDLSTYTPITTTTALTGTAFGKCFLINGTAAAYTVTLPDVTSFIGQFLLLSVDVSGATQPYTIAAYSGQTVDGLASRIMWCGEVALLQAVSGGWRKIAGKSVAMKGRLYRTTDLALTNNASNEIVFNTAGDDPVGINLCYDGDNQRFKAVRPGNYGFAFSGVLINTTPTVAFAWAALQFGKNSGTADVSMPISALAGVTTAFSAIEITPCFSFAKLLAAGDDIRSLVTPSSSGSPAAQANSQLAYQELNPW